MGSIVCIRERQHIEKLIRNVRIHAKDKEFESQSVAPYSNITIPSKGLSCEPHWMELMEVLCTGLNPLEEFK